MIGTSYGNLHNATNPKWWKDPGLTKMIIVVCVLYMNAYTWGYDGTLLNAMQAHPKWLEFFHSPSDGTLGLISAIFYFPILVTSFLASWMGDRFGRRITLLVACTVSIAGALCNTFAKGQAELLAGRAIMGAALGMQSTIGPPLMQEICHPRLRARASAMWFIVYQFATVVAAWVCFGTLNWNSMWAWRLPTLLQITGTFIIVVFTLCGQMPESPRYLIAKGEDAKAVQTLAYYHSNGDENDELVQFEMAEIKKALEVDKQSSYADLVRTPGNRRRMIALLFIGVSGQMCGNALVSYYLAPILKLVGITAAKQVQGINGGLAIFSTLNSAFSAQLVERFGRRPLWLFCTSGTLVCFIIITALSGSYANNPHKEVGIALIPFLYLFFMCYNAGWIVNGALYTTEILPYSIRSKALAVYVFFQTAAICFNQYVNPIGLSAIGWKYYLVFIVTDVCWVVGAYFLLPETKGYTLEEVNVLFDSKDAAEDVANETAVVAAAAAGYKHDEDVHKE